MACDVCCLSHEGFAHVCEPDVAAGETCHKIKTFTCDSCSIAHRTVGGALKSEIIVAPEKTNIFEVIDCDDPGETRAGGAYVPDIRPIGREGGCNGAQVTIDSVSGVPEIFAHNPVAGRQNNITIVPSPPNPPYSDPSGASNRIRHEQVPLADMSLALPDADAYFASSRYDRSPGERTIFTTDIMRWELTNDSKANCPARGEYDMWVYVTLFFEAPQVQVRRGVTVIADVQEQDNGSGYVTVDQYRFENFTDKTVMQLEQSIVGRPRAFRIAPGDTETLDTRVQFRIDRVRDGAAGAEFAGTPPPFVNSGSGVEWHALIIQSGTQKARSIWAASYDPFS